MSTPAVPAAGPPRPPLARTGVDRAAHRRTDPAWLADAWHRARVLPVSPAGRAPCVGSGLVFLTPEAAPAGERLFLGMDDDDDVPYFAVVAELPTLDGARAVTVRDVGALLGDRDAGLLTTAAALVNWHAAHRYSPVTGAPTTAADAGWTRVDDAGQQLFPRTDPAIIVIVHDEVAGPDGRCLLGTNAAWPVEGTGRRFFSVFAGFVEPGEAAEAAVVREVGEEVGLVVSRLRYEGSQAWPFPGSLMLGFSGYADPERPLRLDRTEIADARWFTRTEVAALLAGEDSGIKLPGPSSIAHYLIRTWLIALPGRAHSC